MPQWQINPSRAVGNVYIISELRNPWGSNCCQLGGYFKGYFTVGFFFPSIPSEFPMVREGTQNDPSSGKVQHSLCPFPLHTELNPCQNCTLHSPAHRQKWGGKNKMENSSLVPNVHQVIQRFCHPCVPVPAGKISFVTQKLKTIPLNKLTYTIFFTGIVAGAGSCPRSFPRKFSHPVWRFLFCFPLSDL